MPTVVHIVTTANFAGVERYVCDTAGETAARGWDVTVVGGGPERMVEALDSSVAWLPGATATQALRSLSRLGRRDVCHAHMTVAEAVAVAGRPLHRAPVVATRHFAARRGASRVGRALAPWIARGIAREIAVSDFVASRMERQPDARILNGVRPAPNVWRSSSRTVLVLQRLEPEKDTLTAIRAWHASGLVADGWTLRVVGDGSERAALEDWVRSECVGGVTFAGWAPSARDEFANAGILVASGRSDSFGLAVVEAMASGVPVAASAAGGHLETVGRLPEATLFAPGDHDAAATLLRSLVDESLRTRLSRAGRELVESGLTTQQHVEQLMRVYEGVRSTDLVTTQAPRASDV